MQWNLADNQYQQVWGVTYFTSNKFYGICKMLNQLKQFSLF